MRWSRIERIAVIYWTPGWTRFRRGRYTDPLVPAKAGTQSHKERFWIPAFAGMSGGEFPLGANSGDTHE